MRNGLKRMNISPDEYGFPKKAVDLREEARQQCCGVKSDMMRYLVTHLVTAVAYGIEKAVRMKKPQVMEVIQQSTKNAWNAQDVTHHAYGLVRVRMTGKWDCRQRGLVVTPLLFVERF